MKKEYKKPAMVTIAINTQSVLLVVSGSGGMNSRIDDYDDED